jgi:type VI secretion system secreted protein Hcp
MAAVDFFLKLDGIEGESQDSKHKGEIEIDSWSWGCNNSGSFSSGGGGGTGKVSIHDFHFTMAINKASPKLFELCATGTHLKKGLLTCRKAGGEQQEYLKIEFTDILVSTYQTGASGGSPVAHEQIALNFAMVTLAYKEQDAKGGMGGAIKAGWDLKLNKKV